MLTDSQLIHYETFGFVVLREVFTRQEMDTLSDEFDSGLSAAYAHRPFNGTERHWLMMLGPDTPLFASLLEDERFSEVAEQLYGDDVFAVGCDANQYVGDTRWHPDHRIDPSEDCFGVKFAFYLDPVDGDSGALRVIPGSHKEPLHSEIKTNLERMEIDIPDVPGYVCASSPGDVVAFDMRTWHSSWGGSNGRRMSTCVYYNNPRTPEEEAATRGRAANNRKTLDRFHRPNDPYYHPHWLENHEGHPKRQKWLKRLTQLGFL